MGEREQLIAAIQAYLASPDADPDLAAQLQPVADALGASDGAAPDPGADPTGGMDAMSMPSDDQNADNMDMAPMDMGPDQGMPAPSNAKTFGGARASAEDRLSKLNAKGDEDKKKRSKGR